MNLVFLLGDQLTRTYGALKAAKKADTVILMAEVADETRYAWHHRQKLVFVLSAMRHFADELREAGWQLDYVRLTDPDNTGSLDGELARAVERHAPGAVHMNEAAEYRVLELQKDFAARTDVPVAIHPDTRFIASHEEFAAWAEGRKSLTMEYFYREMRRKTGLLMDAAGHPVGGRWNFDADNRKPADADLFTPETFRIEPDEITREVMALVAEKFADNPGHMESFGYPVTRKDAEAACDRFIAKALPRFGDFQDAMVAGEPILWHSGLSACINVGLLDPYDVCRRVADAYEAGDAPLNAAEGFIRQIIGWREFVRGIYWREMPGYEKRNALGATRDLPWFYWTGETDMACMREALGQTLEHAYAHHIQRLMITGNFALLAGIDPFQVHEWYLAIYIDAFEWVELPNTLGMSQFGDGGLLGSKPYAASANYINKMSDYCGECRYARSKRTGADACPFNALYWDFIARHRDTFRANHRMRQPYRVWDRFDEAEQKAIRDRAAHFLASLDRGRENA